MKYGNCGKYRGFTLVELLVVIAIISVLLAVLLPVLARARDQALSIKCASNLRQVVIAMTTYECDYRSFPYLSDISYGKSKDPSLAKTWVDALTGKVAGRYLEGTNLPGGDLGVLSCPSVDSYDRNPDWLDFHPHYGYNEYVNMPRNKAWTFTNPPRPDPHCFFGKRSRMRKDAAIKILLTETWSGGGTAANGEVHKTRGTGGNYMVNGTGWRTDGVSGSVIELRHGRGRAANVAFMAGNVELVYPPLRPPLSLYENHPFADSRFMYIE